MFPFLLPAADALMLSIRMSLAGAEASRTLWCAAVQAGMWWMPPAMRQSLQPAPNLCAPNGRSRAKTARR